MINVSPVFGGSGSNLTTISFISEPVSELQHDNHMNYHSDHVAITHLYMNIVYVHIETLTADLFIFKALHYVQ